MTITEQDFYLDLLFYHIKLRCFIIIELKKAIFKPEYAGKMNFYCSAVDDLLKHDSDKPTIGLILCQSKIKYSPNILCEISRNPLVFLSTDSTRALPDDLKSSLPSIEEIEAELSGGRGNERRVANY